MSELVSKAPIYFLSSDFSAGSPAEKAGMKEGDVVCIINDEDVTELNHKNALKCATAHADYIEMTVIDSEAIKLYKKLSIKITKDLANELATFKHAEKPSLPEPVVETQEAEPEPAAESPEPVIKHPVAAAVVATKVIDARNDDDHKSGLKRIR